MNKILTEDEQLLLSIQSSNRNACSRLFKKYYPILCAYCHKFVSLEDSEEIVQDVMFWLWESRKQLSFEKSLSAYLFSMVRNKAFNKQIYWESRGKADTLFFEEMQDSLQQFDYYNSKELLDTLKKTLDKLPESYRKAFIQHRFGGLSYKEIAKENGVSPKTIDYRIQQALKILRVELKDYLPLFYLLSSLYKGL